MFFLRPWGLNGDKRLKRLKRKAWHELTPDEAQFLRDAEKGHFAYGRDSDGKVWAMGAERVGNLFSTGLDVVEFERARHESIYVLRDADGGPFIDPAFSRAIP